MEKTKRDYRSHQKALSRENKKYCLPRFTQDVLDSFNGLEICSSASKSHCVKPEFDAVRLGSLLGSAVKTSSASKDEPESKPRKVAASRGSIGCGKPPLAPVKVVMPLFSQASYAQVNVSM